MNHSTPGLSVHHQLPEFTQTHVHWVGDAIQPSHPLSSPSPPSPNPSQHQSLPMKTVRMRWPKYWTFSFSIIPYKEHPGLISFRMDWLDLLVSLIFLKRSLVFPILLFSSISLHWSLRKAFLSLFAIFGTLHSNGYIFPFLLCFSLLFFSQLFARPPQTVILLFCISFSWGCSWSLSPVQCHKPQSIVHQALYQI